MRAGMRVAHQDQPRAAQLFLILSLCLAGERGVQLFTHFSAIAVCLARPSVVLVSFKST